MIDIYPVTLSLVIALLWLATWLSAHQLLYAFGSRFPLVAGKEIPHACNRALAHPEKVIFFFRRRAAEVLREDPLLWRQRQRFILLSVLSALAPVLGFVSLGIVALVKSHR
ncbi:MAG TPA: hypothetical protein VF585_02190 [Chthoniobacterales bacterium]|jgi:hypothetical protein